MLWGSDEGELKIINNYIYETFLMSSDNFVKSNVEDVVFLIKKKTNDSNLSEFNKMNIRWRAFFLGQGKNPEYYKFAADIAREQIESEPYYLAYMKVSGKGVPMDIPGAIKLYAESCYNSYKGHYGMLQSCRNLAWLIIAYKKDLATGLKLLDNSCYSNVAHACESYAYYYSKIAELVAQGYTYNPQDDK